MWENAVPDRQEIHKPASRGKNTSLPEKDFVVRGQIFVCVLCLAFAALAHTLSLPILPALRIAFTTAMQPEQEIFLSEERNLSKFTEQASEKIYAAWNQIHTDIASAETGRSLHAKAASVPSGASTENYLPDFSLRFPLAGHINSKTSGYGWRTDPMGGTGSDFHLGNDLAAAQGTPVLAAADGAVRFAGTHTSYGNYVRILHEGGDETLYAHLQYVFVHTGQSIHAGDVLGTVGETGNATGPHLHFELLHGGIRYDPSEALQTAI